MGADLYWKITPKPVDESYHGLTMNTWCALAGILCLDRDDFNGIEMSNSDIPRLTTISKTAHVLGNTDLSSELNELVEAIVKHQSITLEIRG